MQNGAVIDVCLAAIERCHPYFIGLIGSRYGWVPSEEDIAKYKWIEDKYPVLKGVFDQRPSVTDIEIQYGVLKREEKTLVAYFYFRKDEETTAEYTKDENSIEQRKLEHLKSRIEKDSNFPVFKYAEIDELAKQVEKDLGDYIKTKFPVIESFTKLKKLRQEHAAFAKSRLKVYINDKSLYNVIDKNVANATTIVIASAQGTGKTALLANWIAYYQKNHPETYILYHFIGGASESTNVYSMMLRICEELKEHFKIIDDVPTTNQQILTQFHYWLNRPNANQKWVLVLDALNQLELEGNAHELNWLPIELPENLSVVMSLTPGEILDVCQKRGYETLFLEKPIYEYKVEIIKNYLSSYEKSLSHKYLTSIAENKLTDNVLVLRTFLDELRIYGYHELLDNQIRYFLNAESPMSFFQKVLERFENDYESVSNNFVKNSLIYLSVSNSGLSEQELLELTNVTILEWIPFIEALRNHLVNRSGLLNFSHDYLRQAINSRYLSNNEAIQTAHRHLLQYFQTKEASKRTFNEIPFHFKKLNKWELLKDYLTESSVLKTVDIDQVQFEMLNYWNCLEISYDIENEYENSLSSYKSTLKPAPELTDLFSSSYTTDRDQHVIYALICVQVAKLLMSASKYRLTVKLLEESCDLFMKYQVSSPEHYSLVFFARNMLINIYMKQKQYFKAEPLLNHTIFDLQKEFGKSDTLVGVLTGTLGILYLELELLDKSETCLLKSLDIVIKSKGENSVEAATCFNNLAMLYNSTKQKDRAETYLKKAIELRILFYGRGHPETLTCLVNLAFFMLEQNKSATAKELALEVIESSERLIGNNNVETGRAYKVLGICYIQDGEFYEAQKQISKSYEINKILYGEINANTAECIQWLAICLVRQNKLFEAYEYYTKAYDIYRMTLGYEHPVSIYTAQQVAELKRYL
ncbi:MAG: tetratricopeptide repeat protein [Bacteroidales bacterium]|nr:tetratricopeptide repeat protein [Bacteroidales bacterium]